MEVLGLDKVDLFEKSKRGFVKRTLIPIIVSNFRVIESIEYNHFTEELEIFADDLHILLSEDECKVKGKLKSNKKEALKKIKEYFKNYEKMLDN